MGNSKEQMYNKLVCGMHFSLHITSDELKNCQVYMLNIVI